MRERPAGSRSLAFFFDPRSVAVIGASRNPVKVGGSVLANLVSAGFAGRIVPIGFPVALKIVSADIIHKTDVGGISLGLGSPEGVKEAMAVMLARVRQRSIDARVKGVLVQAMVPRGHVPWLSSDSARCTWRYSGTPRPAWRR